MDQQLEKVPGEFVRVLLAAELPAETKKAVEVAGKSILICNTDDRLYAVSNLCSHARQKLEGGRMQRGSISCPVHGACFDLATGRVLSPPARRPIATFEVRVVDEWIEVLV